MKILIQTLLNQNDVSLARLGQETGLDHDELLARLDQPVVTWSIQFLNDLARMLNEQPGQLLAQLQEPLFYMKFDDDQLMIQTIKFSSLDVYQQVRFAVESNILEGWEPTEQEIRHLKAVATHPDLALRSEIEQLFGDDDRD